MSDKSNHEGARRRTFLKGIGAVGGSTAGFTLVPTVGAVGTGDEVEIVVAYRHTNHEAVVEGREAPEREPVYETIPRSDWVRMESADDARKRLKERLNRHHDVPIRVGMRTSKAKDSAEIVVHYPDLEKIPENVDPKRASSFQEVASDVPATVTGVAGRGTADATKVTDIPVRIKRSSIQYHSANYFDNEYRPVPAGAAWTMIENDEDTYCTTGAPAVTDGNEEPVIITAAHCFAIPDSADFWQYDPTGVRDGQLAGGLWAADFDAALVEPVTFNDVEYDYASNYSDGYRGIDIWGSLSRDGVKRAQDNDRELGLQGARTGVNSAEVVEVEDREFATEHEADHGDSGGPVYEEWYDSWIGRYSYVGGVLSREDSNDSSVKWHTLMESIEGELEVTV